MSALEFPYEVLLQNHESKNCDEVLKEIYKVIHDSSLNEKHDCRVASINTMNINCANDHDWGDNHDVPCDLDNSSLHDESIIEYDICNTTKSGVGRVSTLGNNYPTTLENDQYYDSYIVEFDYGTTHNERGKHGYENLHVTQLPLFVLKLLMLHSSYLHMLDSSCLDNLFAYKMPMHRKYVRLKCVYHMFYDALFVL